MNRKIGMISSLVNIASVVGFALCMLIRFNLGSYFVCMFIAFSLVPMVCAFGQECEADRKASAFTAMIFAGIYAAIILLVYFAQATAVRINGLNDQAKRILDYQKFGLFFSYDLLGYASMALSTFFIGLAIQPKNNSEKVLKWLLIIHGIFFVSCLVMPMLGLFSSDMRGGEWIGTLVLETWCIYFTPIGVLSYLHFKKNKQ